MAPKANDTTRDFTVNLKKEVYTRLTMQKLEERRPMSEIVRDAVLNYLDLFEAGGNGKRKR